MTAAEVSAVRNQLGLSQVQLAQLLGVHPLTVSKWERGLLGPTPHQIALLESFAKASQAKKQIGSEASNLLVTAGVAAALLLLLSAAFGEK
jgi:putative transcriptional regulator